MQVRQKANRMKKHDNKGILNKQKIACLMGNVQDYLISHSKNETKKSPLKLVKEDSTSTLQNFTSQLLFDDVFSV